jgi:flagellar motility protein MotE (MotC chaperone)
MFFHARIVPQINLFDHRVNTIALFMGETMRLRTITLPLLLATLLITPSASAQEETEQLEFSTVEERRIEETILRERESIRREREEIDLRKMELKTIEEGVDKKLAEIDAKLKELNEKQQTIQELLTEKTAREQQRVEELAKIYEKMTPAKAAMAITGLDEQLASELLKKMKVKAAAQILDQVSKQKATDISTTFTTLQLE